ncbi:CoA transferase [Caldimonas thermodepolymerans]|jgi:Predicted acyl-CoA transferases/carnitine dehydratase|uniref:Crotonobetainyl-CoA:carnitine CoA-transferase CaiB-like acyl-CoA transferase n=1 Tax=Caldimonas thermodepolymerans TaxID=215580 RepID=A0A2S5T4Q5_9BURK|nr:CaiB/BaiF CoA-transferase family protein [Caldimonas thermodepolymerans]PPE69932.1 formyl-CoA transferase [Caldimonas thermodepolymerans]QPC31664.1 CoA transferase [Caldimonas thermodepolymerans]RDH94859.1 crotonobetainyl-CoA:carnitine CoA-transferase CaiB-like acyl-CoA transferase [Caldimonas thermodepolymerans]TCP02766.1 crotonobetainyl-CoA:carnitine CoA-transferase CaiB-like acyl-CoA transferase [Caldimonas thermodepolymerans]UZG48087.1 CoA transferase [Caldimonas thermodepolymerans]
MSDARELPLSGVQVLEFTHMVMGPTCGMILADLGADVIKVEPLQGDSTRRLPGSGTGFFATFNRNKKSVAIDVSDPRGLEIVRRLAARVDIFSENFKSGTMARLGLDYARLSQLNERLVYVSHKGFLPGPYEHRTALDEVVQMMGGLAYMTGRPGDPLRAGASVNDIMGGMFGAIGAMAALRERERTGRGQEVLSSLFENNVLLVASHMMQYALTGRPAAPMPARVSAWGIYDVFTVAGGEQIFLAVVSDTQWQAFCDALGFADLRDDERLATNNQRVMARSWLMPLLRERLATRQAVDIAQAFESRGLPYAPIRAPHELLEDPHLDATGGLAPMPLPDGREVKTVLLPLMLDGTRLPVRAGPPSVGAHTDEVLATLGYTEAEVQALRAAGVVA